MNIKRFAIKVGKSIAEQSVSLVSLIVSLTAMTYDSFRPTTIPTGQLSVTSAGGAGGISLFVAGAVLFGVVLAYGIIKAVNS